MALSAEQEAQLKAAPPEQRYRYFARRLATKYGIDPDLYEAQIDTESTWNPRALGEPTKFGRARGLAQFIPDTGKKYGLVSDQDFFDPVKSLDAGARYMRDLTQQQGSQEHGILEYHGGPGPKGRAYLDTVLQKAAQLRQNRPQAPAAAATTEPPADAVASTTEPVGPPAPPSATHLRRLARNADVLAPSPDEAGAAVAPTEPSGHLAQFGSGLAEGAAGTVDLPAAAVNYASGTTGASGVLPTLTPTIEPHLAEAPTSFADRLIRKAGQGTGALGVMAAAPVLLGSAVSIAGVMEALGLGAAMGATGEVARTGAEKVGAGPYGQAAAEIGAGMLVPAGVAAAKVPFGIAAAKKAAQGEVAAREVDLAVAQDAHKAEMRAMKEASTDVRAEAREAKSQVLAGAQAAGTTAREQAVTAGQQGITQAQTAGSQRVASAEATAQGAAALAATREAETDATITRLLVNQDPADRAKMARATLGNNRAASEVENSAAYEAFFDSHPDVRVPFPNITVTAREITEAGLRNGMQPAAAEAAANRILAAAEQGESISLREAHSLRSELGATFGKKTQGAVRHRAGQLFRAVDRAVRGALPEDALPAWDALRANRTEHARVFQNKLLTRMFDGSPEGRAAADQLVAQTIAGGWKAEDKVLLDSALEAVGTNTVGHDILKDSVLRTARDAVTTDGVTNYQALRQHLTNREGLAPLFESVVPDPRERHIVLSAIDDAMTGRAAATAAAEQVAIETAAARTMTQAAEEAARVGTTAAKAAAQRTMAQTRADLARRLAQVRRMTTQAVRTTRQRGEEGIAHATTALDAARSRLAPRRSDIRTVGDVVLEAVLPTSGYQLGALAGDPAMGMLIGTGIAGIRRARTMINWLRIPQNRAFFQQAARTDLNSVAGRRMLTRFGAMTGQTNVVPMLRGPQPVAADEPPPPAP